MTASEHRHSWIAAAGFALVFDMFAFWGGWLLTGPPRSMEPIHSFKTTVTIGLPAINQLLDAKHQTGSLTSGSVAIIPGILFALVLFFVTTLATAYFIGLLARSVESRDTTVGEDARRAFFTMFLWLLFQFAMTAVLFFLFASIGLPVIGGIFAVVALLWFRYYFLFFEYACVVLRLGFGEAWEMSARLRRATDGGAMTYFILSLLVNAVLAYFANALFSLPGVFVMQLLYIPVITWLQHRLMRDFFDACDKVYPV